MSTDKTYTMCLYPKLLRNKKYTETKKNGGKIPFPPDPRVLYIPAACGTCMECRHKKAREWTTRLLEEIKTAKNGRFITLTFSDEKYYEITENTKQIKQYEHIKQLRGYDRDNATATAAIRMFLERWRRKYRKSLKHWFTTELGHKGTNNIHLHGIIWTDLAKQHVQERWGNGYIWMGYETEFNKTINYVNEATVNYLTKYFHKQDAEHKGYNSIILTSPGIGSNYTNTMAAKGNAYNGSSTNETYRTRTGNKTAIPIYWRNKIYTELEREQLWIEKLNKQERYVMGEKVDVSTEKGMEEYFKLQRLHQARSNKFGYIEKTLNWKIIEYEKQIRDIQHATRIRRGIIKQTT